MPLMLWNAYPIARRAWQVWRRESRLNIDFLDTLAISASLLQGNPMAGAHRHLADQARRLDPRSDRGGLSARAISELLEFQSKIGLGHARRRGRRRFRGRELAVGDLVVVYPGEMIPVDGEIIDGHATIDQKTITGEGLPVTRGKGEAVFAATVIREGQITVRAMRVGTATTAGQIARLVEFGADRRHPHAEPCRDASPIGW